MGGHITGDQVTIGGNDGRGPAKTDPLSQLVYLLHRRSTHARLDGLIQFCQGQRLLPGVGTPDLVGDMLGLRIRSIAWIQQVAHRDSKFVDGGNFRVQVAAVGAVSVGKHRNRV